MLLAEVESTRVSQEGRDYVWSMNEAREVKVGVVYEHPQRGFEGLLS